MINYLPSTIYSYSISHHPRLSTPTLPSHRNLLNCQNNSISTIITQIQITQNKHIKMYKHLNCVADHNFTPVHAFLFKPYYSGDPGQPDDFKRWEGDQFRRLLFEGWAQGTYTPAELDKLAEFEKYLQKQSIVLDQKWDVPWRLRFLLSTNYDFERTVEEMHIFLGYMGRVQDISFTHNVSKNLRKGLFYIAGRDHHYRPILVFDALKIIEAELSEQQIMQTQIYFFEYVMRHCFIPGQVESWVAIIDSAYQGFFSLIGALQNSFKFLSETYRMRLYCCYNVRINFAIRMVWNILKNLLDQETINKINLVEEQTVDKLFEHCNREQVEQRFGGTLPDIQEGHFWPPPVEVSPNYSLEQQPTTMMTREEYTQNHKNKVLYDTKIHEELLIKDEPVQNRENNQKKVMKHLQKEFQRELQETQQQKLDFPPALAVLTRVKKSLCYFQLQRKDKESSYDRFK